MSIIQNPHFGGLDYSVYSMFSYSIYVPGRYWVRAVLINIYLSFVYSRNAERMKSNDISNNLSLCVFVKMKKKH